MSDWSTQAACRTTDPDELFLQETGHVRAKAVCTGCPVRTECLADALDNRVEFGVWGGMSERERRALLRRRPAVTSWRRLLQTARTEYEQSTGVLVLERPASAPKPLAQNPQAPQALADWPAELELLSLPKSGPGLPPGQLERFEAVFRRRFTPTVAFLIAAGAARYDAEDAVQGALVQLHQKWEVVEHPEAWLRKTAWRMWMKAKGREHAWPSDPAELPDRAVPDPCGDITEQVDLVQLLRRLPAMQRTVMAFEVDGATPMDTAEALGVPAANVRQNLLRARRTLQRLLDDLAEGDLS